MTVTDSKGVEFNVFSADDLIEVFGDQAYHKGVRLAYEAIKSDDRVSSRLLAHANLELIRRGYHKKEKA